MVKVLELFGDVKVKVHSDGSIETVNHKTIRKNGRIDNRRGKILKPGVDKYGYHRVVLSYNGKRKTYLVHRLVAQVFIPNPKNKPTVNHKNGIKTDNRVENLEWATQSEQKQHSIKNHLCDRNIKALSEHNINVSRKVIFDGVEYPSIRAASRLSGWSQSTIARKGEFVC